MSESDADMTAVAPSMSERAGRLRDLFKEESWASLVEAIMAISPEAPNREVLDEILSQHFKGIIEGFDAAGASPVEVNFAAAETLPLRKEILENAVDVIAKVCASLGPKFLKDQDKKFTLRNLMIMLLLAAVNRLYDEDRVLDKSLVTPLVDFPPHLMGKVSQGIREAASLYLDTLLPETLGPNAKEARKETRSLAREVYGRGHHRDPFYQHVENAMALLDGLDTAWLGEIAELSNVYFGEKIDVKELVAEVALEQAAARRQGRTCRILQVPLLGYYDEWGIFVRSDKKNVSFKEDSSLFAPQNQVHSTGVGSAQSYMKSPAADMSSRPSGWHRNYTRASTGTGEGQQGQPQHYQSAWTTAASTDTSAGQSPQMRVGAGGGPGGGDGGDDPDDPRKNNGDRKPNDAPADWGKRQRKDKSPPPGGHGYQKIPSDLAMTAYGTDPHAEVQRTFVNEEFGFKEQRKNLYGGQLTDMINTAEEWARMNVDLSQLNLSEHGPMGQAMASFARQMELMKQVFTPANIKDISMGNMPNKERYGDLGEKDYHVIKPPRLGTKELTTKVRKDAQSAMRNTYFSGNPNTDSMLTAEYLRTIFPFIEGELNDRGAFELMKLTSTGRVLDQVRLGENTRTGFAFVWENIQVMFRDWYDVDGAKIRIIEIVTGKAPAASLGEDLRRILKYNEIASMEEKPVRRNITFIHETRRSLRLYLRNHYRDIAQDILVQDDAMWQEWADRRQSMRDQGMDPDVDSGPYHPVYTLQKTIIEKVQQRTPRSENLSVWGPNTQPQRPAKAPAFKGMQRYDPKKKKKPTLANVSAVRADPFGHMTPRHQLSDVESGPEDDLEGSDYYDQEQSDVDEEAQVDAVQTQEKRPGGFAKRRAIAGNRGKIQNDKAVEIRCDLCCRRHHSWQQCKIYAGQTPGKDPCKECSGCHQGPCKGKPSQ